MKRLTAVLFLFSAGAVPALAGQCQDDIAKIDKALATQDIASDVRAQVEDMRSQAVQLCGAGNDDEGTAVTAEAKALLAIE